jgi:hypothetical protein
VAPAARENKAGGSQQQGWLIFIRTSACIGYAAQHSDIRLYLSPLQMNM